MSWRNYCKLYQ